ncbi:MAG: DUF4140 domain-containing protein [Nitrospinae bacterium]|nr:DUF4140 domain-containing protein [Nitrospinota bacterium]
MQNFVSGKPTTSFVLALCVAFYLPTPAWASPVDSAIVRVRLYTDRAEVTRRMRTEVSPGPSSLTLRQLPSALVPGSVRLRQIEGESVTLNNVKTDRVHGSKFSSKGITEQEQLVKKFQSRYDALEDEIDVLHQQLEFIASLVKSDSAKNKNLKIGMIPIKQLINPNVPKKRIGLYMAYVLMIVTTVFKRKWGTDLNNRDGRSVLFVSIDISVTRFLWYAAAINVSVV